MSRRITPGRRVEVSRPAFSHERDDDVFYQDETGTVIAIHDGNTLPIEVELDYYGWSAMFHPTELKVIP